MTKLKVVTKNAETEKIKKLALKRVTVKDLAVKAQNGAGIRGGGAVLNSGDACKPNSRGTI